jgi:hypothetical protein
LDGDGHCTAVVELRSCIADEDAVMMFDSLVWLPFGLVDQLKKVDVSRDRRPDGQYGVEKDDRR